MMQEEKPAAGGRLPEMPPGTRCHVAEPLSEQRRPVRAARECVRAWCRTLGIAGEVAQDLDLACDELVANASGHGEDPVWLRLALIDDGRLVSLDVYDAAPITPRLRRALEPPEGNDEADIAAADALTDVAALDEHGRGLRTVLGLASEVEVLPSSRGCPGKTIRALFPLAAASGATWP